MFEVVCRPDLKPDLPQVERFHIGTYIIQWHKSPLKLVFKSSIPFWRSQNICLICLVTAIKWLKFFLCLELAQIFICGFLLCLELGCVIQQLFKLMVSLPLNQGGTSVAKLFCYSLRSGPFFAVCSDIVVGQSMKKNLILSNYMVSPLTFVENYIYSERLPENRIRSLLTAIEFRSASRSDFMMKMDWESFIFRSHIVSLRKGRNLCCVFWYLIASSSIHLLLGWWRTTFWLVFQDTLSSVTGGVLVWSSLRC